ncbi:hypothetical protein K469DRAFT_532321, partial [Zopfia rhizophila CBS 207.26]
SKHLQRCSQLYWVPGRNLAVNESMQKFTGRSREITTISCKAASTGYKTWMLRDQGYILNWLLH